MSKVRDAALDFFNQLKRADALAPVYYIFGEEMYLLDRALAQLIEAALPEGPNAFNMTTFHGKDAVGAEVLAAAETLSFMPGLHVVLIKDAQEMTMSELDELSEYLDNPNPRTCLIVHAMTVDKSLDGRKGVVRKLKKVATVGEFKPFYEADAERFLVRHASERGLRLDEEARATIQAATGTSLQAIVQAIEKLDLYLGKRAGGHDVVAAQVREIIADTRVHSVFELTDAVGDRRIEDALHLLNGMILAGEAPIKINAMLTRHFRILAKLHDPTLRSASRNDAAREVGVSPYFLKDYQRHAQRFSASQTERLLDRLLEIDAALKSSKLSDHTILETFILEIAV